MKSPRPICPSWLRACYRFSLRVYPAQFRAEYGALMEQAFADRYASLTASGKMSEKIRFALDTLRDSGQSLCSQHWHATEAAGFVRLCFLILFALFAPLVFFHETLISKATDGILFIKNIKEIRDNAWRKEYEENRLRISFNLRHSEDPVAVAAANLLERNSSALNYPSGEELRQMNLRIAREIIANPLHNSWFSKPERASDTPAANMYSFLWNIENYKELKRCNDIGKENGNDASCNAMWDWMLEEGKYAELMIFEGYQQPSQVEILRAFENNQYAELKRQYIALNGLDTACKFSDSRRFFNNISCTK